MYRIIIFGPQGSGKGTQGKMISEKFGIPLISAGTLLRNEIAGGTEIGKQVESILRQGRLVPDELITDLARERLKKPDAQKGFILDGYPRTRQQFALSTDFLNPTHVLVLQLDDNSAIKRLSERLVCPQCGNNYHLKHSPPKHNNGAGIWLCDDDAAVLAARDDDKPSAVQRRLSIYHQETEPLFEIYRSSGIIYNISAEGSIEEIHQEILKNFEYANHS